MFCSCGGRRTAYGYEESNPIHIESRQKRFVQQGEADCRRYGVLEVPGRVLAFAHMEELQARIHQSIVEAHLSVSQE